MDHRRSGPFSSPVGCGATVIFILALSILLYLRGGGPFSPGPLSAAGSQNQSLAGFTSHADFEAECSQCHVAWKGVAAANCQGCHTGVGEQIQTGIGLHGLLAAGERCQECHVDHRGREAALTDFDLAGFEHGRLTGFSLVHHEVNFDGTPLGCDHCHINGISGSIATFIDFDGSCHDCHLEGQPDWTADHGAFFGQDCLACHDGVDSMADFDHQAVFALEGAHTNLKCADCHQPTVLAGTANDCAGCHQEPMLHLGQFGTDCARCHTDSAWRPAELTQHTFPLDHGGEGKIPCDTCHTQSYAIITCYNCHAHNPSETIAEHLEEGITDIADCAACHPTGREEEAEEVERD